MSGSTEKMESLTSLIHRCITACSTHVKGCEEDIVNRLNDVLQRLISHIQEDNAAVKVFGEDNRLSSDCLMSLLSVLGVSDSVLGSTILSLFNLLGIEESASLLLYSLGAMDTLVCLLEEQSHQLQVMNVIAKLTKYVKYSGHEDCIDRLLAIVTNNVLSSDVTLKPSLCVLVNIASGSLPIQMQLRSLDRSGMLRKTFIKLVSHDDNEISVVSLAAMTSTGMSEEFNKLINSDKNLDQILKLCFSIILSVSTSEAFGYVVDVLVHLLNNKRVQQFLVNNCSQLDSFISKSACLLTRCEESQLAKLFELLLALAYVPAIRLMLTSLVFAPVRTSTGDEEELLQHIFYLTKRSVSVDYGASVSALKLITYIYEDILSSIFVVVLSLILQKSREDKSKLAGLSLDPSQAGSTCHLNFQFLTECLKQNELDNKRNSVKSNSADKIMASLCLLEVLVTSDAFSSGVLAEIEPATITDVIEHQLQSNPIAFNWNNKLPGGEGRSNHPSSWNKTGVEIVLKAMSVIIEATERNESYSTCLTDYLQKTSVLPFLATGLSSSVSSQIQLSLKVISKSASLSLLQATVLSDVLSSINNSRSAAAHITTHVRPSTPSCVEPTTLAYNKLDLRLSDRDNKENVVLSSPCLSPRGDAYVIPSSQSSPGDIAGRLGNLKVDSDGHISDIISVYEQKLKAQKTKETHLDDLVQAKTMALSQADRLIHQYKSRLAQVDSETQKLRSIVHESERRSESYREKMNEMLVDRERLLQDSRKLDDTLRTLASVNRELDTLNDLHSTLTNFTDNLKQQHRELESEYSLLKESDRKKSVLLTEKETYNAELRKNIKKIEDQVKKLTNEKAKLRQQCDSLADENKNLEKNLKQKEEKIRIIFDTVK